jgi:2-polyprenyl-3-methyl-5-hydroxy-6-metoxy-1,4-benzoquinol methylase
MDHNYDKKTDGYFSSNRSLLMDHIPPGINRLLDVGCAAGNFGAEVKAELDIEVWGVEPFEPAALEAGKKLDRVLCATAETALSELPDAYFDCVSFNDVLEHIVDPWAVLNSFKNKLAPGGKIFACIPNVMFHEVLADLLLEADWRYRNEGVLDQTHLRFFTRKSIIRMFKVCGYEVSYIEGLSPGTRNRRLKYLDRFVLGGRLNDMQYIQFVVHASPAQAVEQAS